MVSYAAKVGLSIMAAAIIGTGVASCGPTPVCLSTQAFNSRPEYVLREQWPPYPLKNYDVVAGQCVVGQVRKSFATPQYKVVLNNKLEDQVNKDLANLKTISGIGFDADAYNYTADGKAVPAETIRQNPLKGVAHLGGYFEIINPDGKVVATLVGIPFGLHYDIIAVKDGKDVKVGAIDRTGFLLKDTYKITNDGSAIDNQTLAGILALIDGTKDDNRTSSSSTKSK